MFVGVADTCPGSQDLRGCKRGKPCWSFLPTDVPRPSTHKGPLPCGQGIPCFSSRMRIPLMADSDSIPIADSVPGDGGHVARVS
ncbi:hypothetical protein E4O93_20620 [Diaphorobacter sp. DS2]|nr:hypothetical protein E4O93_20620 [Diaphorobacter sp. DS2]